MTIYIHTACLQQCWFHNIDKKQLRRQQKCIIFIKLACFMLDSGLGIIHNRDPKQNRKTANPLQHVIMWCHAGTNVLLSGQPGFHTFDSHQIESSGAVRSELQRLEMSEFWHDLCIWGRERRRMNESGGASCFIKGAFHWFSPVKLNRVVTGRENSWDVWSSEMSWWTAALWEMWLKSAEM